MSEHPALPVCCSFRFSYAYDCVTVSVRFFFSPYLSPSIGSQEKEALEQAMRENEAAENEMKRLQKEKERREEAERSDCYPNFLTKERGRRLCERKVRRTCWLCRAEHCLLDEGWREQIGSVLTYRYGQDCLSISTARWLVPVWLSLAILCYILRSALELAEVCLSNR